MPEQVQNILNRVLAWWKGFSRKQKALMISLTAVVILALGILVAVVSRPTYVELIDCEDSKSANEVKELLDSDGDIDYKVTNITHFEVNEKDENAANWLLGSNDIQTSSYDYSDPDITSIVGNSMTQTESDTQKLYKEYKEKKMAADLAANDLIDSAKVTLDIPDDDGTLVSRMQESSASVSLSLTGDMTDAQAYAVARFVATALGNSSTEKVTIIDQKTSTILYDGTEDESDLSTLTDNLEMKEKIQDMVVKGIKNVMVQSGMYSDVQVAPNLDIDYDKVESAVHNYSHNDGSDQGELTSKSEYYSDATGGATAETPGTDSNDDTTYVTEDGDGSSSNVTDIDSQYSPNEEIIKTISNGGGINYDNSTIAVTATRYVVYDEDELKESGELDGTTFAEFKASHSDPVQVEISEEEINIIAMATGLDTSKIAFMCYERPQFVESSSKGIGVTDILQILLAVLIFALLGYVVFRTIRKPKEEAEPEPELSVDALLEATAEAAAENLEDIGYSEKSETRVVVEKFVDENPEAAALLLRNWLNEDWD
jgi:flagellar M-ring protein FliF